MSANDQSFVACRNGVFTLPEPVFRSLQAVAAKGFVYLRQDCDVLTISPTRIAEGRRRTLNPWIRAAMFRDARTLAIVDLCESVQVMAVAPRLPRPLERQTAEVIP